MSNYCLQTLPQNNTASGSLKDKVTVYDEHRRLYPKAGEASERGSVLSAARTVQVMQAGQFKKIKSE